MAMSMNTSQGPAQGLVNGSSPSPSPEEKEQAYDQLLQLRDVVLAGKHAQFKLPQSAIEQLKASLIAPHEPPASDQNGVAINGHSFATNKQQQSQTSTPSAPFSSLPGLQNEAAATFQPGFSHLPKPSTSTPGKLDPIFLQKSDQLVRAETQLKRQRLERDLGEQVKQRRQQSSYDKDQDRDGPSRVDIELVYLTAMTNVKHVSGLKATASVPSSSFDENDYYSSQVQSEWSSDASDAKASDRATGAFTGDFERLDGSASKSKPKRPVIAGPSTANISQDKPRKFDNNLDNSYDMDEDGDDDEYSPPDAAAFDSSRVHRMDTRAHPVTPEGDDSDYEPGEITADSINPSPSYEPPQQMQPSASVPVIRNHLTHIAAPQPNRVSPLTTKDSNIELELVNGRPEVVRKPSQHAHHLSRVSSASPAGYSGPGPSRRQKKQKKRKRDNEPQGRNKRRQRQAEVDTPRSRNREPYTHNQEPFIKDEPVSPPPDFANVPAAPQYDFSQYGPPQIDLTEARPAPHPQYTYDPQPLRYQYPPAEPQQVVQVASPAHRPVQRDTQDLRRVASLHNAKRPRSPQPDIYPPVAPYRAASMAYGNSRLRSTEQQYQRPQSPAASSQRYDDAYSSRAASPALMPPPPAPAAARQIVQDQYGNRYYAAEAAPQPPATVRASAVPDAYARAPSRAAYAPTAQPPGYYEPRDDRMAPPPGQAHSHQANGVEEPFEYTDADGYIVRGYRIRPVERPQPPPSQYSEAPTSPTYQEYRPYEQMPPPPQPPRQAYEPTSPTYQPNISRSYSVRPEQPAPAPAPHSYLRQASVAPIQYVPLRQGSVAPAQYAQQPPPLSAAPAPQRAVSVMPGYEYAGAPQAQQQHQAPPRFVDQYGQPVYPREIREVRQVEDYYRG